MPPNKECWSIYVIFLRERCMVSLRHFGSHVRMFWRDSYEITNWVQNIFSDLSICNICSLAAILCIWWLLHSWLSVVTDLEQIDEKKTRPTLSGDTQSWVAFGKGDQPQRHHLLHTQGHDACYHINRETETAQLKLNLASDSKCLRRTDCCVLGLSLNGIPEEMSCYLVWGVSPPELAQLSRTPVLYLLNINWSWVAR